MKPLTMTPDAFRRTLDMLGLAKGEIAARELGVDVRTVRRYLDGTRKVPGPVVRVLQLLEVANHGS